MANSACHSVIIVVKIKIIHIYHAYRKNIPWGLVQKFVYQPLQFPVDFQLPPVGGPLWVGEPLLRPLLRDRSEQ